MLTARRYALASAAPRAFSRQLPWRRITSSTNRPGAQPVLREAPPQLRDLRGQRVVLRPARPRRGPPARTRAGTGRARRPCGPDAGRTRPAPHRSTAAGPRRTPGPAVPSTTSARAEPRTRPATSRPVGPTRTCAPRPRRAGPHVPSASSSCPNAALTSDTSTSHSSNVCAVVRSRRPIDNPGRCSSNVVNHWSSRSDVGTRTSTFSPRVSASQAASTPTTPRPSALTASTIPRRSSASHASSTSFCHRRSGGPTYRISPPGGSGARSTTGGVATVQERLPRGRRRCGDERLRRGPVLGGDPHPGRLRDLGGRGRAGAVVGREEGRVSVRAMIGTSVRRTVAGGERRRRRASRRPGGRPAVGGRCVRCATVGVGACAGRAATVGVEAAAVGATVGMAVCAGAAATVGRAALRHARRAVGPAVCAAVGATGCVGAAERWVRRSAGRSASGQARGWT